MSVHLAFSRAQPELSAVQSGYAAEHIMCTAGGLLVVAVVVVPRTAGAGDGAGVEVEDGVVPVAVSQ